MGRQNEKVSTNGLCQMTKLAAMPIYGKTFKNILLLKQKADDPETCNAALVIQVLSSLLK